jgi:hypothetical protein
MKRSGKKDIKKIIIEISGDEPSKGKATVKGVRGDGSVVTFKRATNLDTVLRKKEAVFADAMSITVVKTKVYCHWVKINGVWYWICP